MVQGRSMETGDVKATKNRSGVNVHITKEHLSRMPDGDELLDALDEYGFLWVGRSASKSRNNAHLAFKPPEESDG